MPVHSEKRRLPYTPEQVFNVVAEVDKYPEFLPWCKACRITRRQGDVFFADLIVSFKVYRERFTSKVVLDHPRQIDVEYIDGPFRYLKNRWRFEEDGEGGCIVDFFVDFEFKSRILQGLIGLLFNEAVQRMVRAFEERANELYGPSIGHATV
ncbi:coenzyme Q-binding protein COQ10 [Arboricoccus pini]|uniref:Coenzyme Q-binding protein COQ10 n=1 Tax=Arboricoccus pini TaxID=1963835 RepID=A0A212QNS4_9PROT|nr:type II toxin-antitoxin system RatA family toxin [Arboricoccus pini]SNB61098.1 coenzyme Q-binding protein COQ10 [Arboricoccus pini]